MKEFLDFLRERIALIKATEANALHLLEQGDEAGYREGMREKALVLADLAEDAQPFLADIGLADLPMLEHRLAMFSQSAQRSLDIGSVFYMSALLYPEDHQPGEPTTLEVWLHELERRHNT